MAKRILVPLDKSTEHATILPVVADMARGGGATVRLLHVAPVPQTWIDDRDRILAYADQEMVRLEGEAMDRLLEAEAALGGIAVERIVRFGRAVEEILKEAEAFGADLIAVTTICSGSLKRRLLGSVAEQLVRSAKVPVVLLRPGLRSESAA